MPVSFNSPARNFFLLGSSGAQVVTNFFNRVDQSTGTDGIFLPDEIKYNKLDQKFLLAGSASDSNYKGFGWFEKRNTGGSADWDVRVEATQAGINTTLRAMELDSNNNLIVVGKTGDIPWIAKYDNDGVIDWQSTTNSGDVEYTGITSDSNGNYYACGNTSASFGEATAFVEKFDASGNPGWGKAAFMLGRDVVLNKVAANNRGEVVAVGYIEDDSSDKGYIVKIDTTTGEVLWDRTLDDNSTDPVVCNDVFIDDNDQIYVVGNVGIKSYIIKYTAEGNIIWQKSTSNTAETITYDNVKSDSETEQTIVFGTYDDGFDKAGILTKYSKNGDLVWRRILYSSFNFTDTFSNVNLDADPSFYYILFTDGEINELNGTPFSYTFGKVSSSGNGLGNFEYFDGSGETIYYEILDVQDEIGRLTDGSVRQDSSDLITYPFSANKLLFDDLATQVSNKKRQMDSPDSFEYSGSPAIRPADFQELNLLGDVYSGSGNWLDQSGKGNDGVVNGATWNASGWWEFDGVNDRISFPDDTYTSGDITIEGWSWNDTLTSENNIFNIEDSTKGVVLLSSGSSGGYGIRFLVRNGSFSGSTNQSNIQAGTGVTNEWHHYVGTWNSSTGEAKAYIDGALIETDTNPSSVGLDLSGGLQYGAEIGPSAGRGRWHDGRIGEVRIYPRALTAAQVFQNYNATREKYTGVTASTNPNLTSTRTPV